MFNTSRAAIWERSQQYGNDLYQVSSHQGARPLCYPWQGKVISTSGRVGVAHDLDGGEIPIHSESEIESFKWGGGLFGVNCGHYPMVFIDGVSTLKGEPQDPEDNAKTYAESQQQRALERKLREEKRDLEVMKAQGASPQEIAAQRERVRNASADIDQFCDDTGRARKRSRESAPVRATWHTPDGDITRFNGGYIGTDVVPPPKGQIRQIPPPIDITNGNVAQQATNAVQNVVQSTQEQYKLSDLSGDYADTINAKFKAGNETARKAWERCIPNGGCIEDAHYRGTPHESGGKVYLNIDADAINERGVGCTFFHENGHAIDYYADWLSDDEAFYNALKADYEAALKATGQRTKDDQRFALSVQISYPDVRHKANGVSDIIEGLSGGKCVGCYGHGAKYWRDRQGYGIQREAFAHMNEAAYLDGQREMMEKYFPTAFKRFIELLEGVI